MALISTADLSALVIDFNLEYQDEWDNSPTWTDKYAKVLPCSGSQLDMPWTVVFQQMTPWIGNRKVNSFILNTTTYKPVLFQNTIGISRSDVEDDKVGLTLAIAPQRMAREIKRQPEVLLSQELEANPLTFDGYAFFSALHPVDSTKPNSVANNTNSNVLLSSALTAENVNTLQAQLLTLAGPDGTPTAFFCSTLMVHPSKANIARQIANQGFYPTNVSAGSGGTAAVGPVSNQMQGFVEVVVNPYLTDPNRWYLFCTDMGMSPLLWIERTAPEIEFRVSPSDWNVFDQDQILIGARRRCCAGLGLYYKAGVGTSAASLPSIPKPLPIQ